jgi:hypothetical protein
VPLKGAAKLEANVGIIRRRKDLVDGREERQLVVVPLVTLLLPNRLTKKPAGLTESIAK